MSGIIRAPRPDRGWTEIPNAAIRDRRLSYKARGVLVRLLSNADGFRMTAIDLACESRDGRQSILSALRELREAGYIVCKRWQNDKGHWGTETYVFDNPQVTVTELQLTEVRKPDLGSPDSGSPDAGSPDLIKKYQEKNQKKKQKEPPPPPSQDWLDAIEVEVENELKRRPIMNLDGFRNSVLQRYNKDGGPGQGVLKQLAERTRVRERQAAAAQSQASPPARPEVARKWLEVSKTAIGRKKEGGPSLPI